MSESAWGIPLQIIIMWSAGTLYALAAISFLISFHKEMANELMQALFAFLLSMALALNLMGTGEYSQNMIFGYLGTLSILVGSVFILKFPLTVFPASSRKTLFRFILLSVLVIFIWMVTSQTGRQLMPQFIMWYMIIANGLVAGFFIFFAGLRSKEKALKIKAMGGGMGIASCCIVSHIASISGAIILSAIFQFLSPILLMLTLFVGHHYQKQLEKSNMPRPA